MPIKVSNLDLGPFRYKSKLFRPDPSGFSLDPDRPISAQYRSNGPIGAQNPTFASKTHGKVHQTSIPAQFSTLCSSVAHLSPFYLRDGLNQVFFTGLQTSGVKFSTPRPISGPYQFNLSRFRFRALVPNFGAFISIRFRHPRNFCPLLSP